jgi:hypothetical protein
MRRLFPLIVFLTLISSCKCRQTGVIYPNNACSNGSTTCMNGRPYACGGGAWRPVGDGTCAAAGGVCCVDAASQVHACVSQDRCAPTTSGGNGS